MGQLTLKGHLLEQQCCRHFMKEVQEQAGDHSDGRPQILQHFQAEAVSALSHWVQACPCPVNVNYSPDLPWRGSFPQQTKIWPPSLGLECTWNRKDIKNRWENSYICSTGGNTCRVGNITIFKGSHQGASLPVPTWTYAWLTPGSAGTSPRSTLTVLNNVLWHLPSNNITIIEFW